MSERARTDCKSTDARPGRVLSSALYCLPLDHMRASRVSSSHGCAARAERARTAALHCNPAKRQVARLAIFAGAAIRAARRAPSARDGRAGAAAGQHAHARVARGRRRRSAARHARVAGGRGGRAGQQQAGHSGRRHRPRAARARGQIHRVREGHSWRIRRRRGRREEDHTLCVRRTKGARSQVVHTALVHLAEEVARASQRLARPRLHQQSAARVRCAGTPPGGCLRRLACSLSARDAAADAHHRPPRRPPRP